MNHATLYYAPGGASLLVHWLLVELDLPHTLVRMDLAAGEQHQAAYLTLNPAGVVPTLVMDGVPMTEAAAIALWLVDLQPRAGLAPVPGDPQRAALLQWMFHLANAVQPVLRQWWYPAEGAGADHVDAARAEAETRLDAAWERIDAHLATHGPGLLGDTVSVADLYLTMLLRWSRRCARPGDAWPRLGALAARMKQRPAFAVVCDREDLQEWR